MDCNYPSKSAKNEGHNKLEAHSPSIMQSLDFASLDDSKVNNTNWHDSKYQITEDMKSIYLNNTAVTSQTMEYEAFQLLDRNEKIMVTSVEELIVRLHIAPHGDNRIKIVSILGNCGDGKSYTLNHAFFNGLEVFTTSTTSSSCTTGVWAAYNNNHKTVYLDTEGLLSSVNNEFQRIRLLLKVLAISDVVIYKSRSDRLHSDLFTFLNLASRTFSNHFQSILQKMAVSQSVVLGPALIIFHETKHTKPLQHCNSESPEEFIRKKFASLNLEINGFSSLKYLGIQSKTGVMDFTPLNKLISHESNFKSRGQRSLMVIFNVLKQLTSRFSGSIEPTADRSTLDLCFTCPEECLACETRCQKSVGHLSDNIPHSNSSNCTYRSYLDNCKYLCKACGNKGKEQFVKQKQTSSSSWYGLSKYVWSGYTVDCPNCGEIYSSRQFWLGSKLPGDCHTVETKLLHAWRDNGVLTDSVDASSSNNVDSNANTTNTGRKVIDSVTYISESVAGVVSQPTKLLTSYVADQIAPKYWRPNYEITECEGCKIEFSSVDTKHHCRSCGEGFCEKCSTHSAPVLRHGWTEPVRVCDKCYDMLQRSSNISPRHNADVRVRKYGELFLQTFSTVATVFEYPKEILKESVRPAYWVPDHQITHCKICEKSFDAQKTLHHCRDCGQGVCNDCSTNRKPVPSRGWEQSVRVCDTCYQQA